MLDHGVGRRRDRHVTRADTHRQIITRMRRDPGFDRIGHGLNRFGLGIGDIDLNAERQAARVNEQC